MTDKPAANGKRRNIRFKPDMQNIAQIDLNSEHSIQEFQIEANALILDESYTGCGLIYVGDKLISKGTHIIAKIGNLGPLKCEIVWTKAIDEKVLKLGIKYLD